MPSTANDRRAEIWTGTIILSVAATIAVVCRFIARRISLAKFWWDDWLLVVSLLLNWAMNAVRWSEIVDLGYGEHAKIIGDKNLQIYWKRFLSTQVIYFANSAATKISLLLLYYRIFGVNQKFRLALMVCGAFSISYFIACTFTALFGCHPVSYFWNKHQSGKCINQVKFFRGNGIVNLLIDVMILCLPMPLVWRLKIERRQKIILSALFLLGGFVCAASIIRVIAFNQFDIRDPTYTSVGTATWSSVEQSLAIVCAGLITMRPLFGRVFSGVSNSKSNTDGGSHPRPADVHLSEMGITRSRWRPSSENESRVGFARLPEDVLAPSAESHELSYPPIGAAVSSAAGPGSKADEVIIVPSAIVKKMEIEQRTDSIYGPAQ